MDAPAPRRRFQFSLRTLMILVTLLAIPCGCLGCQAKIVRDRQAMIDRVVSIDKGFRMKIDFRMTEPAVSVPWIRRLLGDEAIDYIDLPLDTEIEERLRIRDVFPEAKLIGRPNHTSGIVWFPEDATKGDWHTGPIPCMGYTPAAGRVAAPMCGRERFSLGLGR